MFTISNAQRPLCRRSPCSLVPFPSAAEPSTSLRGEAVGAAFSRLVCPTKCSLPILFGRQLAGCRMAGSISHNLNGVAPSLWPTRVVSYLCFSLCNVIFLVAFESCSTTGVQPFNYDVPWRSVSSWICRLIVYLRLGRFWLLLLPNLFMSPLLFPQGFSDMLDVVPWATGAFVCCFAFDLFALYWGQKSSEEN